MNSPDSRPSAPADDTLEPLGDLTIDRRRLFGLAAAAAAGGVLAACGGDESSDPDFLLVQRFSPTSLVPGDVRLPFSISRDAELLNDGPAVLNAQILDQDGGVVLDSITATRRDVNPFAYYAFRAQLPDAGIYSLVVEDGPPEGAQFQLIDPRGMSIPVVGDEMPALETPTFDDQRGVDPICTLEPECDFHYISLDDALETGNPIAFLVGTPAFCATGTCIPALDALIAVSGAFIDRMDFIHAEVYTDLNASTLSPTVESLALPFEPVLYVVGGDGRVTSRLDAIWNEEELSEVLDSAVS
ncbi:MAG: hypothetical protein AAF945_02475 [Actinomycetota bacterium]